MKKLSILMLALFCITSIVSMQQVTKPYKPSIAIHKPLSEKISDGKCNNMIMVLDPLDDEPSPEQKSLFGAAATLVLTVALIEKTAPVLCTKNVMRYVCMETIKHKDVLLNSMLNDNNWHCVCSKNADLVLLIPKNYQNLQMASSPLVDQINSCGFNINNTHFDIIKKWSAHSLLNYLTMNTENSADIIESIKKLFSIAKIDDVASLPWNMYIMGHGYPSYDKKTLSEKVQSIEKSKQKKNNYKEKMFQQSRKLLDEAKNSGDNTIISDSGQIAGLMTSDFLDLLTFFNKNLKVSFLHYATCFSTGSNLAIISDFLSKLNVNFIVSCQGITEQSTNMGNFHNALDTKPFQFFFFALCNFFNNPSQFIASHLGNDPIRSIMSTIVNPREQALVRIPLVGIFNPFSVDKHVKILTNALIKAHEFENKPIDCSDPDIEVIVVYSSYIGVPIKMNRPKTMSNIALALPQKVESLTKRMVCVFKEMDYPNRINFLMDDLSRLNRTYVPITFVIKKLQCLNDNKKPFSVENMVFSIKATKTYAGISDFKVEKTCFFSVDNTNYLGLSNEWGNISSFSPTEKFLAPEVVSRVIDQADMKNIPLDKITLPIMVEQLEKKTSKEFSVQQPGFLQKILEQKMGESTKSVPFIEESTRKRIVEESRSIAAEKSYQPKPSAIKIERE